MLHTTTFPPNILLQILLCNYEYEYNFIHFHITSSEQYNSSRKPLYSKKPNQTNKPTKHLPPKKPAKREIVESFSHAYKIWRQNTFHAISWASALQSTQHSLDHFFPQVLQGKPIKHQKTPACHVKFTTYWNSVPYSSNTCWLGSHHEPHS